MGKQGLGVIFVLISTVFYSLQGVLTLKIGAYNFNSNLEVLYLRTFYGFLGLLFVNLVTKEYKKLGNIQQFTKKRVLNFLICSASVFIANMALIVAFENLGVAIGIVFFYSSVFFTIISGAIFFKEKITPIKVLGATLIILGLIIVGVAGGTTVTGNLTLGVICGLISGLGIAFYNIFAKKSLATFTPLNHNLLQFFIILISMSFVISPTVIVSTINQEGIYLVMILGIIIYTIAYPLFTKGLSLVESSTASVIVSFEIILGTFWGLVLLHENITSFQILGTILILIAVILNGLNVSKKE